MGLLEKLKKLFESGQLTEEEMTEAAGKLEEDKGTDGRENQKEEDKAPDKELPGDLEVLIQNAVNKAIGKLGDENKKLQGELEKVRREHMSEDEIKKLEYDERIKELQEKEAEIRGQQLKMYAISAMKKSGLENGDEDDLKMLDYLMAEDETGIDQRTADFKALMERRVGANVERRFKDSGRDIKGNGRSKGDAALAPGVGLAKQMGETASKSNEAAQNILNMYTGGNAE